MIASGGKNVKHLVPLLKSRLDDEESGSHIILWEAYEAKTMRQIKLIEETSSGYLDNHDTVHRMIKEGGFKDGTKLCFSSDYIDETSGHHLVAPEDKDIDEISQYQGTVPQKERMMSKYVALWTMVVSFLVALMKELTLQVRKKKCV